MPGTLKNRRGFTLTEMIITTAVLLLVGVAITSGINAGAVSYRKVTAASETSVLLGTLVTELADVFRFARNIDETEGNQNPPFDSPDYGPGVAADAEDGYITVGGKLILPKIAYETNNSTIKAGIEYTYTEKDGFALTVTASLGGRTEEAEINIKPLTP